MWTDDPRCALLIQQRARLFAPRDVKCMGGQFQPGRNAVEERVADLRTQATHLARALVAVRKPTIASTSSGPRQRGMALALWRSPAISALPDESAIISAG